MVKTLLWQNAVLSFVYEKCDTKLKKVFTVNCVTICGINILQCKEKEKSAKIRMKQDGYSKLEFNVSKGANCDVGPLT